MHEYNNDTPLALFRPGQLLGPSEVPDPTKAYSVTVLKQVLSHLKKLFTSRRDDLLLAVP